MWHAATVPHGGGRRVPSGAAEVARLCALGVRVRELHDEWTTLLDPEGNPYCVLDPREDQRIV